MGPAPDGVEIITWDGGGERPPALERTEFWVPQVEDASSLEEAFAAMPDLKVVQLTSAGVEGVVSPRRR